MTTKQYPIISVDNFSYAVDKSVHSGKNWYIFQDKEVQSASAVDTSMHENYPLYYSEIVASTNPSLGLPLIPLEDDITKLAQNHADLIWLDSKAEIEGFKPKHVQRTIEDFEAGYKAAKAKSYTEEDIRKALRQGELNEGCTAARKSDDEFIKSLQPTLKVIEIEMEDKYEFTGHYSVSKEERPKLTEDNYVIVKNWIYE